MLTSIPGNSTSGRGGAGVCSRTSGRSGFTLVELLVVLCLVALFLGIALPAVPVAGGPGPLRRAALDLAAFCAAARVQAVEDGGDVFVAFDLGRQRYGMAAPTATSRPGAPANLGRCLPAGVRLVRVLGGEEYSGGRQVLRFSRKGYAPPARFLLKDARGSEMSVLLDPFALEATVRPGRAGAGRRG